MAYPSVVYRVERQGEDGVYRSVISRSVYDSSEDAINKANKYIVLKTRVVKVEVGAETRTEVLWSSPEVKEEA